MCGRFALFSSLDVIRKYADLIDKDIEWIPHYNISPSMVLPVLVRNGKSVTVAYKKWGYIPDYTYPSENDKNVFSIINAKAETIAQKPVFRSSFKTRRCLVPANGFYEWRKKDRQPFFVTVKEQPLIFFGGIWNSQKKKQVVKPDTFAIITTKANNKLMPVHQRMPVIIHREMIDEWLFGTNRNYLLEMLAPYPDEEMELRPVSKEVNFSKTNHEKLISPDTN